jgi:hypothetical protein
MSNFYATQRHIRACHDFLMIIDYVCKSGFFEGYQLANLCCASDNSKKSLAGNEIYTLSNERINVYGMFSRMVIATTQTVSVLPKIKEGIR